MPAWERGLIPTLNLSQAAFQKLYAVYPGASLNYTYSGWVRADYEDHPGLYGSNNLNYAEAVMGLKMNKLYAVVTNVGSNNELEACQEVRLGPRNGTTVIAES